MMIDVSYEVLNSATPSEKAYSEADFDGYQAAPLLIVGSERKKKLVEQQDVLGRRIEEAIHGELTPIAKPSVVEYVARSVLSRMHEREALNGMSYMQRLYQKPRVQEVPYVSAEFVREACRRAKLGEGTPTQQDMARRAFGMASAELANLTIINDFRKREEGPMWDAVSELMGEDASPQPDQMYGLKILSFDRDITKNQHMGAMRIGMKRVIGVLDDGTLVKGRTTAIVNLRPASGFDQSLIEHFKETDGKLTSMAELPEFKAAVDWLISDTLPSGLVLARNETIYEVNADTRGLIDDRRAARV